MLPHATELLSRVTDFQRTVRTHLIQSRTKKNLHAVDRDSAADTIYAIDAVVDPLLESFCEDLSKDVPLILIAEGLEPEDGRGAEGVRVYPKHTREDDAKIRLIVDPIDGTRGLMYDKRSAWSLAGIAPNRGPHSRLQDIELAVMTELPTSKQTLADTLWALKGQGAQAIRTDLRSNESQPLALTPSQAPNLLHGFASIANFFPGTKVLASELMEQLVQQLVGPLDVTRAAVFDDQYISTGGQFYELIVGHDRFNADLRPLLYKIQSQPEGLCCHPYDCATALIATEAGVHLTNALGQPLDGPLDTTTGISWAAFANPTLRSAIEPLLTAFLKDRGA